MDAIRACHTKTCVLIRSVQTISKAAHNVNAQPGVLHIIKEFCQRKSRQKQKKVWLALCVGHLFPPIRFHFCCVANLWHSRMRKSTVCCTTETCLSACLWVPVTLLLIFMCVDKLCCADLYWWYCGVPVQRVCGCVFVSTT